MRPIPTLATVVAAALVLAACGSGSSSQPTAGTSGSNPDTVTLHSVNGVGNVLVDADGHALYATDQEAGGHVLCVGACTSIWRPLAAGAGAPTASGDVGGLGVVTRPDGSRQVTAGGRPLYTFAQDGPGQVTGNGLSDAFGGRSFTWHAALANGLATGGATTDQSPSGYSY